MTFDNQDFHTISISLRIEEINLARSNLESLYVIICGTKKQLDIKVDFDCKRI